MADQEAITELEERLKNTIASAKELETVLYSNEEEEEFQKKEMARIEEGYKALNRKLSSSEKNRWGYSPSGWMSKKLVSKHLNSVKTGLNSVFPIPCKQERCPYGQMCIALQNGIQPPYGEPCVIEVTKIENLIVSYANDFNIDSASTTDRVFIQELIQLDLLMDRCQNLMAQDGSPLQEVIIGSTEDGDTYTQPVVSRYYEAWDKMSRRRQSILDEMMATRKSRKGIKEETMSEEEYMMKFVNADGDFFQVEERPEKFKKSEE